MFETFEIHKKIKHHHNYYHHQHRPQPPSPTHLRAGEAVVRVPLHEPQCVCPRSRALALGLVVGPQPGRVDVAVAHGRERVSGAGVLLAEEGRGQRPYPLERGAVVHVAYVDHLRREKEDVLCVSV